MNDVASQDHLSLQKVALSQKLVFIVGAPRSGTTWLRMLLAQAPAVVASKATHLYSNFLRSFIDSWKFFEGHSAGLDGLITEDEAWAWMRDLSNLCFNRVSEQRAGARIILEKSPSHALHGADILRLYPKSYFIHVTRIRAQSSPRSSRLRDPGVQPGRRHGPATRSPCGTTTW